MHGAVPSARVKELFELLKGLSGRPAAAFKVRRVIPASLCDEPCPLVSDTMGCRLSSRLVILWLSEASVFAAQIHELTLRLTRKGSPATDIKIQRSLLDEQTDPDTPERYGIYLWALLVCPPRCSWQSSVCCFDVSPSSPCSPFLVVRSLQPHCVGRL
jgi:hypothetical protein